MMWHTTFSSKKFKIIKKFFYFSSLLLALLGTGIFACGGGATGGGGSIGSGGNGAAPPLSIPAPEALNMVNVTVSAPDTSGVVTVTGTSGAAIGGADVRVRNIGPQMSWYQKAWINSAYAGLGDEVVVKANADGSFVAQIKAMVGDRLAIGQKTGLKYSLEIMDTVQNVPTHPSGFVPASEQKFNSKMKMTLDPNGNGWTIQGASSKKWNLLDLFISTAYAADDIPVQSVNDVTCPQNGPCSFKPSTAPHEGYCDLSKTDANGKDLLSLSVPYCKGLNAIEAGQIKGPPDINYLAIAAGNNAIILKEAQPDKWIIENVLRFPVSATINQITSDYNANDLIYYFYTPQGLLQYSAKNKALSFYTTKVGQLAALPTASGKRGNNVLSAFWMNNQASLILDDVILDPNFTFQRPLTFSSSNPVSQIVVLLTDGDKSVDLLSGEVNYKANRYALIAGKKVYLYEIPTYASYADLYSHPDFDASKVEKLVTLDFSEASKDFTMIADNPEATVLAVSNGDKIYYVDYTFGETIPLQAVKLSHVTDLSSEGPVSALVYNPVSRSFILRTLGNALSATSVNASANAVDRGHSVQITLTDSSNPTSELRAPRETPGGRDVQPTIRSLGLRPSSPSSPTPTTH